MPHIEGDDYAIIADFIVQKDKVLGREIVYVIDEWDALRRRDEGQAEPGERPKKSRACGAGNERRPPEWSGSAR
jgi:hypothetical protein